ncbi:unnamed protein product [Spirodela intermedia]|uniref:Uncharacterized protein n=1 Tax=Spirodela intermedia TaxID=51605 RepID=A0A7I8J5A0_SPIIN|nr:unnamed protein product [Spirodela intermedia]CAA6664945.1 unnamed protein product [Spirodela intermedia]
MEGQATKLTRTPSSLLRSPTVRSIQSLSALDEEEQMPRPPEHHHGHHREGSPDEEKKRRRRAPHKSLSARCPSFPAVSAASSLASVLLTLSVFSFLFFYYLREESPFLGNLLLASAAVAVASVAARRSRLLCFSGAGRPIRGGGDSVEWFIGDSKKDRDEGEATAGAGAAEGVKEGVEMYNNGDYYEGEFHRGKCNGSGVYYYFGNGKYEGDWVDGRYDGYGIESWARGSRYRGQYRHGLRHGVGVYRFYAGDCYAGEWLNGQSHGIGVQTCSDGSCYVGEFKCGVKHGLGSYHFRCVFFFLLQERRQVLGEYFGDKIHGFGVYQFANGHRYEGSWHEGRKQGFGVYTFRNSDGKSGEWDHGVLKAARKAAQQAVLLPRVDERVNRAVAAANRAATAARVAAIKAVQNRMDGKFCDIGV